MDKTKLLELFNKKDRYKQPVAFRIAFWNEKGQLSTIEKAIACKAERRKMTKKDFGETIRLKNIQDMSYKTLHPWLIHSVNHLEYIGI